MMETTPHLAMPLLISHQAHKDMTHNEALVMLDALLNTGAIDQKVEQPPADPTIGDVYILGDDPKAQWQGHKNEIAYFFNGWRFIKPSTGMRMWVMSARTVFLYEEGQWVDLFRRAYQQVEAVGIQADASEGQALAVHSRSVLFSGKEDSMQVAVNKAETTHTASLLWQRNFSTKAEMGLVENDALSIKMSEDGSNFTTIATADFVPIQPSEQTLPRWQFHVPCMLKGMGEYIQYIETTETDQVLRLDLSQASLFRIALRHAVMLQFVITNSGFYQQHAVSCTVVLEQDELGQHEVRWEASVKWQYGSPPLLSSKPGALDILSVTSFDQGQQWFGFVAGYAME